MRDAADMAPPSTTEALTELWGQGDKVWEILDEGQIVVVKRLESHHSLLVCTCRSGREQL